MMMQGTNRHGRVNVAEKGRARARGLVRRIGGLDVQQQVGGLRGLNVIIICHADHALHSTACARILGLLAHNVSDLSNQNIKHGQSEKNGQRSGAAP